MQAFEHLRLSSGESKKVLSLTVRISRHGKIRKTKSKSAAGPHARRGRGARPSAGLAPKIGCSGWKRRLQTVTYPPNLVRGDPEMYTSRLRCICAWGQAPSPMAPRSRGVHQKKSTKSHSGPLCNRGRRTHLRVALAALPAASRASICSFASCPLARGLVRRSRFC